MKKIFYSFTVILSAVILLAGCEKNDETETPKQVNICEIGNTGKVVSSYNVSKSSDGSPIMLISDMILQYSPDYSKIAAYNLSDSISGMSMKKYSFVLHGDSVIDDKGEVIFSDFKFNDKGYVCHLVELKEFSKSQGTTHFTYDIAYNAEDRMSKITYSYMDANEKLLRIQNINIVWENGLLKEVQFDNNGKVTTTIYEYGNQTNVHHQPSVFFFRSLNSLSLDNIRPFLIAGYFGKGSDKFEVSSYEQEESDAEKRTYSVELDAEGKINALHEVSDEGKHVDYTFKYSNIK